MVLEALVNPFGAEQHPWSALGLGVLYTSLAILLSLWIFPQHGSLVIIFLTVLACTPLLYNVIRREERKSIDSIAELSLLKEHGRVLSFLLYFFAGMTLCFAGWYIFLPEQTTQVLFQVQSQTIYNINNEITGNAQLDVAARSLFFVKVLLNNIKVMFFCILFSFLYGVGAIFILAWNASIIATAIGNFIRSQLSTSSNYFAITSLGIARYAIHGIPEVAAYFIAGIAGGIISVAMINHELGSEKNKRILLDSVNLILIATVLLVVAAALEVFVVAVLF